MQVCTLLQTDNHASTPPLSFLQARCPSCHPTNSVNALKAQALKAQALKAQFAIKAYLNILPQLKYVTTVPHEISMLKNRNGQEVIEANCHVRLSHSKSCFKYLSGKLFIG